MLAAGTLRGTRTVFSLLVLLVPLIGYAYSSPLQYLPSIPGYVPVYIRYGDEPLEEINPDLAEAFGETSNSIKSLQKIEHTLAHEPDGFKDDDIDEFLEGPKRKHAYPLHVREAESRSFATVNDDEPGNPNKPKLLTIYELPDDNDRPRRRYRGRTRMKSWRPPAFKVGPLSDEEKEELEKLAVEVEKEETKPNELYVPNSKYPELPPARARNRHKGYNAVAPLKVQVPIDKFSSLEIPQVTRLSKPSGNHDDATFEAGKKEPPIKEQRPATILSNVDKLSPIDLPDESKTNEGIMSKVEEAREKSSIKQAELPDISRNTNLSKSSDDHNIAEAGKKEPPVKVQRPATILSNVDKLSPIDLPDERETSKDNKTKDSTEPNDAIAME